MADARGHKSHDRKTEGLGAEPEVGPGVQVQGRPQVQKKVKGELKRRMTELSPGLEEMLKKVNFSDVVDKKFLSKQKRAKKQVIDAKPRAGINNN